MIKEINSIKEVQKQEMQKSTNKVYTYKMVPHKINWEIKHNGEITKTACACVKILSKYVPAISATTMIKFSKRDSRYSSERKFYFSRNYSPVNNRNSYDYDYQEFKIYHVVDEFNESIIELHKNKSYGERLGFKSKEECQKYCDWLNRNNM